MSDDETRIREAIKIACWWRTEYDSPEDADADHDLDNAALARYTREIRLDTLRGVRQHVGEGIVTDALALDEMIAEVEAATAPIGPTNAERSDAAR